MPLAHGAAAFVSSSRSLVKAFGKACSCLQMSWRRRRRYSFPRFWAVWETCFGARSGAGFGAGSGAQRILSHKKREGLQKEGPNFRHWLSHLQQVAACGREPLFLNFDETSIAQWWSQPVGCVAMKRRWLNGVAPQVAVPTNRRRGSVTLGALITHRTDLQPLLPQLLLGNKHVLSRAFCAEVKAVVSPSLHVWAEKSGWVNQDVLVKYLSLVADTLDGFPECQPTLLMDCAPAHLGEGVLQIARDRGLFLCFVPAGCTAHVQPLDVGCFSPMKALLRREAREALSAKSVRTKLDWALAINKAATQFLCSRRWVHVFQRCGVIGDRAGLRGPLASVAAKYLEVAPAAVAPSPDVIASLLPRNRAVCYHDLLPEH